MGVWDTRVSLEKCRNVNKNSHLQIIASGWGMEAAGIEPASCDASIKASTCVFRRLVSPQADSTDKALLRLVHHLSYNGRSGR